MQYSAERLILLAKRENNNIRPYLYVNPLQGKHIPANPEDVIGMCRAIAGKVNAAYPDDMLYVIGFAETATGIAACVASFLNNAVYYQNTTRESDCGDYILFSEVHSHATDQMLRAEGIGKALGNVSRIIFIDDEVTTGNTICNLIGMLKSRFRMEGIRFSIVSLLNSMSDDRFDTLKQQGIDCLFLDRIPHEYRKDSIMDVPFDPGKHVITRGDRVSAVDEKTYACPVNPRSIVPFRDYLNAVREFAEEIRASLPDDRVRLDKVLVLGTEEFMYPTFVVGEMIRQQGYAKEVRIHSTSRSPIVASDREGYPLFCRYQIRSPYDPGRTTFIYNLGEYDRVFILTDAAGGATGLADLYSALDMAGNKQIELVKWQYTENEETV